MAAGSASRWRPRGADGAAPGRRRARHDRGDRRPGPGACGRPRGGRRRRVRRTLEPTLGLARSLLPAGGHLVVASALDAPGPGFDETLTLLAERVAIRLILVSDAFERARPPGFYPFALADGRRGTALPTALPGETAEARLADYARRGIAGVRLDVEAGPEAYAPLMERLDAVL
nr:hypothetical protein [Methylobacterium sp. WL1]